MASDSLNNNDSTYVVFYKFKYETRYIVADSLEKARAMKYTYGRRFQSCYRCYKFTPSGIPLVSWQDKIF